MSTTYNVTKKPAPDKYSGRNKSFSSRLRGLVAGECLEVRGDANESSTRSKVATIGRQSGFKFRTAKVAGGYDIFRIA